METAAPVNSTVVSAPPSVPTNFVTLKHLQELRYKEKQQQRQQQSKEEKIEEEDEEKKKKKEEVIDLSETMSSRDSWPREKKFGNWQRRAIREANLEDTGAGCGDELLSRDVVAENVNREESKASDKANVEAAAEATDGGCRVYKKKQQHQQQRKEGKIEQEEEEKKKKEVIDFTETRSRRDSWPREKKFGNWQRRAIREANLEDPGSGCGGDELLSRDVVAENVNREESKASDKADIEAAVEAMDAGCRGYKKKQQHQQQSKEEKIEKEDEEKKKKEVIDLTETRSRRDSWPRKKKFWNRQRRAIREANLEDPGSGCCGDVLLSRDVMAENVNREESKASDKADIEAAVEAMDAGCRGYKKKQQHQQQSKEEKIEKEDEEKKKKEVIDLTETRSRRDSWPRKKKFWNRQRRAIREANLEDPGSGCCGDVLLSRDVMAENVNREESKASDKADIEAAVEATDAGCRGYKKKQQHQQQCKEEKIEEVDEEKKKKEVIDLTETRSSRDSWPREKKFGNRQRRAIREANLEDPGSGCGGDKLLNRDVVAENVNCEESKAANIEAAVEARGGGCRGSTNLEAKLRSAGEEPKATKKHNRRTKKNGTKPKLDGHQKNGAKPNTEGEQKSAGGDGKLLQTEDVPEQLSTLSVKEMEENYEDRLKKIDRQKSQAESPHSVSGDMVRKRLHGYREGRRGGPSRPATVASRKDGNVMWVKKETCLLQDPKV